MLTPARIRSARRRLWQEPSHLPRLFGTLGDLSRYRIVLLLLREREVCATDVARVLEISVPAASQQLRLLELAGLVERERMGRMMCCRIRTAHPFVRSLRRLLVHFPRTGDLGRTL